MKVYVVRTELWEHDHEDARLLGSVVEGVFDSEEKAMEYITKYYGDNYRDGFDCGSWKNYQCDTYEGMASIFVENWEVNEALWEDLA